MDGFRVLQNSHPQIHFPKTFKQSFFTLLFDLGGIIAGLIVASSFSVFSSEGWIIAIYPGILSMRGVIGGLFTGRLSTGLHLGTIKAGILGKGSETLHSLWGSILVLAFVSSLLLSGISILFGTLFYGLDLVNMLAIFVVITATMGLSLLAISPITLLVALFSFKKGLDPDIIVYPIISTVADILSTLCYIFVLILIFFTEITGKLIGSIICLVFFFAVLFVLQRNGKNPRFMKTIKEALFTMIVVAFLVNITGSVLSRISRRISQGSAVYVAYPALINTMGDVGAIVGSTATTKLALGTMDSSLKSVKKHGDQIVGALTASIVICLILALFSSYIQIPGNNIAMMRFVSVILITNLFSALCMI